MKKRLIVGLLICFLLIMVTISFGARPGATISMRDQFVITVNAVTPGAMEQLMKIVTFIYRAGADPVSGAGQEKIIQISGITQKGENFRAIFIVKYNMDKGEPVFTELIVYYEVLVMIENGSKAILAAILLTDSNLDGRPEKVVAEKYLVDDKGQILASEKIDIGPDQATSFFQQLLNAFAQSFIKNSTELSI